MNIHSIYDFLNIPNLELGIVIVLAISITLLFVCRWIDYLLPFWVLRKNNKKGQDSPEYTPKISVVIPANNQVQALYHNLETILKQDYPNFEVVIVDESENTETKDLIEKLQREYKNLRKTFVPQTFRNICKRKFSITLGVRAARGEWVVLTNPQCIPNSNQWLSSFAIHFNKETDVVLGCANYTNTPSVFTIYKRLRWTIMGLRAVSWHKPFWGDACNMAFRKSAFIESDGYAESLGAVGGEAEMLIKAISKGKNTRYNLFEANYVNEECPHVPILKLSEIAQRETIRYCKGRVHLFLLRQGLATFALYTSFMFIALGWMIFAMKSVIFSTYDMDNIYTDVALLVITMLHVIIPSLFIKLGMNKISPLSFTIRHFYFDLILPINNLYLKVRRWQLRKDFKCR